MRTVLPGSHYETNPSASQERRMQTARRRLVFIRFYYFLMILFALVDAPTGVLQRARALASERLALEVSKLILHY